MLHGGLRGGDRSEQRQGELVSVSKQCVKGGVPSKLGTLQSLK
jgi:hypothetical protein